MPTTVAARRGFGDRERNMMFGDRRLEGIGRTAGSRPEGWRYEVGEFGGGGKIKVRKEKERELGELSSGSEADSPTAGVVGVGFHWPASVTVARKRGSASAALVGENGKKARVTCRGDAVVVDGPISQCHPIFSGWFEGVNVCRRLENVAPGDSDDSPDASICCKSDHLDEEGEVFITRNISLSRWASEDNISEGEESFGRKKGAPPTLKNSLGWSMKLPTPTIAERSRDRSDDVTSSLLGSGSEHDCRELEKGRTDHMDLDAEDSDLDINNSESDVEVDLEEILAESPEHVCPQRKSINMLQCCQSVNNFERLNRISEGTYGVVYRARDKKTGEILALKQVKMAKEREGFPLTALREINILLSLNHPSIIDIKEVVVGDSPDKIYLVMEYMDHDLKVLMESMKQPFSQSEVKCLMLQLLEGVCYLHDNWVLHRDLKTSNLLFNNRGELKICDFGLSRQYGSPLKPYTPLVVTLWYRAPELLLGAKQYSTAVDMWSLGCIMAELLSKEPLFNGKTEVDQLDKIFKILGVPNEKIWPGFADLPRVKGNNFVKQPYNRLREKFPPTSFIGHPTLSERGFDLLSRLLTYDPEKRITAEAALRHEWFMEVPLPKSKDFMPTFPAKHAQEAFTKKMNESRHLDGLRRKELQPAWEMNNHSRPSLIEDCPDLLGGDFFTLSWKELSCRILVSQVRECSIYIEV